MANEPNVKFAAVDAASSDFDAGVLKSTKRALTKGQLTFAKHSISVTNGSATKTINKVSLFLDNSATSRLPLEALYAVNDSNGNKIVDTYLDRTLDILTGGSAVAAKSASEKRTGDTGNKTYYYPTSWKFNAGIALKDGFTINIKMPSAGHDYGVWLSVDNGSTYKPISISNAGRLTTHFPNSSVITLVYDSTVTTNDIFVMAGGTGRVNQTGGAWRVLTNYNDGNDRAVLTYNAKQWKIGGTAISQYDLVCENTDGLLVPAHSVAHQVGCQVYIADNARNANSTGSWSGFYDMHYNYPIKKGGSSIGTHVNYAKVYLHGTISGGIFTPDATTPYVIGTANCNTAGHFYMFVGDMTTSSGYVAYNNSHPYYYYTGSTLICTTVPIYGGATS